MEIVIVGAGPVGCYTAQLLKKSGIKARIIEEHNEVGKPVKCAGIVGKEVFENTLLTIPKSSIINQINGALFFYGDDNFQIKRERVAYVIDRERFDKDLSKGLEVEYGRRLLEIEKKGKGYRLKTSSGEIYADVVIGADGPKSRVRRFMMHDLGLGRGNENRIKDGIKYHNGWQYRIKLKEGLSWGKIAQVYMGEGIPFFIWVIPESEEIVRLGVISKNGSNKLDHFMAVSNIKGEIIGKLAGIIPLGLIKQTCGENIAVVGDAAGQVKPLTGGGIYYGLKSAEILAECIREGKLTEYDRRWKRRFGKEIKFGLRARKIYERLNKRELKNIFWLLKENADFIEKVANFENHSSVFKDAFKNPMIFIEAGKILGRNIGKILF
ncbi:MAG: NAD(P)/FAD-dependent oxidoreductase [Candidatus Atribacteria bacterium]